MWNSYPVMTAVPVLADTLLNLDTTATPPSAGQVKQLPLPLLGQALSCTLYPSGVTSGVTDAAAVNAAVTAGYKYIRLAPTAPWYIACGTVVINASGIYIDATGCLINAVGAGDMIDMHDTSTFSARTVNGGGVIGFPIIDGTATTGNACAVHTGDIFQLALFFQAQNFTHGTTSKGLWLDNRWWIGEQVYGRVFTENCTAGIVFDVNSGATATGAHVNATGSFERCNLDLYTDQVGPTFDGVVLQNGAFIQDGVVGVHGNFGTSVSALTSAALRINGTTPSGITTPTNSNIQNSVLNIGCEVDTSSGTNAPFTVNFGTGNNFIANCTGNIDFGAADPFQSSNNGGQFIGFVGVVAGDANLPSSLPAGSTNLADSNQVISATSATAITNVAASVAAFTAYDVRIYIPHLGAATSGTFQFALGGPSIALASLDVKLWTGTTLTQHTLNSSSANLGAALAPAASQRTLEVTGTIACSAAGTLTVTGAKSAGGSNVTVDIGASIVLTPLSSP